MYIVYQIEIIIIIREYRILEYQIFHATQGMNEAPWLRLDSVLGLLPATAHVDERPRPVGVVVR